AANGDARREQCLREAATPSECSYVACQRRAQSHAATVPPSTGSKRHASRSQKAQIVVLTSCQHHLYTADLHQMVLHRPVECTASRSVRLDFSNPTTLLGWLSPTLSLDLWRTLTP